MPTPPPDAQEGEQGAPDTPGATLAGSYTPWLDPRRALRGASARWELLLEAAYQANGALFAALYELRRRGGRSEHSGPANWTLQPEGPLPDWRLVRGAELTADEYTELRQRGLAPHGELLSRLLRAPQWGPVVAPEPNSAAPENVSLGEQNGPAFIWTRPADRGLIAR